MVAMSVNHDSFNMQAEDDDFVTWYGYDEIIDDLKQEVSLGRTTGPVNGWAVLASCRGPAEVADKVNANTGNINLISGLLLSATVPLLISPPDAIASLSNDDARKIFYVLSLSMAVALHFVCVVVGSLLTMAFNTCARDADLHRMIMRCHYLPTSIYFAFTIGDFMLALAMSITMQPTYGNYAAIYFASLTMVLCTFVPQYLNFVKIIPEGHVVAGWRNVPGRQYDVAPVMSKFEGFASRSAQFKKKRF